VAICLERGADLLMPLLLTVSCFSKIQIGFAFLVLAHLGIPGKGPLNGVLIEYYLAREIRPPSAMFPDYFTSCVSEDDKLWRIRPSVCLLSLSPLRVFGS